MESSEVFLMESPKPNNPNSIEDLINVIKVRTAMYIGTKSLTSLRAFIDGWAYRSYDTIADEEVMGDFDKWLRKRYNMQKMEQSWDSIIRFWSIDEQGALELFFELFEEFTSEKKKIKR